ncbi:MAG: VRR-NUC domain-containing protein, partial [Marinobacter sp.]|nr:VRR-NUC domain-containing protein [Marinobacter sp.]
ARSLAGWCPALNDCVFALTVMDLCDRFRLLFFGNLRQDWSEFVLADLGIYQYETVPFTPESRAFQRRADVDAYIYMHDCRDRFEAGEAVSDVLADVPRQAHANPWLEARRGKLLYSLAQQFERDGALADAQALYRDCTYPGARVRCIRVLERCEELATAYAMAEQALEDPESEAERQHLDRILPRLRRKLGHPKQPRAEPVPVSRIDVTLTRQLPVELALRDHFHRDDAPVHYVENTLINGLFGLLCWDVLFAPLPGAFFHPFQRGPADLLRPDFHRRRADAFRERFAELDSSAYRSTIRHHYRAKFNLQSPFVVWGALTPALLDAALDCLPPAHLKLWFERLLRDIRANRAGMPDLIQFYPEERRYRMIEVKGPGDRLQDNQLRWLDFCARHDMPVDVCYVSWSDDGPNGGDRA